MLGGASGDPDEEKDQGLAISSLYHLSTCKNYGHPPQPFPDPMHHANFRHSRRRNSLALVLAVVLGDGGRRCRSPLPGKTDFFILCSGLPAGPLRGWRLMGSSPIS